jgi:hypothetical protein
MREKRKDDTMEAAIVFSVVGVLMVVIALVGRMPPGSTMDPQTPEAY